jgi:hypothetical protein
VFPRDRGALCFSKIKSRYEKIKYINWLHNQSKRKILGGGIDLGVIK